MKIIFLSTVIIFSNIILFSQSFGGGDGLSKATAYEIWTKAHLEELGNLLSDIYYNSSGKHFCLMTDIDGITQTIGYYHFNGHFHGNGKTITVNMETSLFSVLGIGGSIDSLTVNGTISNGVAGIVVANMSGSTISNCINNATIIGSVNYSIATGGITGSNRGIILNCVNNGSVSSDDWIGGIAGENQAQIISCINTGKITATNSGTVSSSNTGVGGIVGSSQARNSILNSINIGTVSGQGVVGGIQGNFVGTPINPASITNCINYGFVKGPSRVGGIVGDVRAGVRITGCSNFGVVSGDSETGCIVGINNGGTLTNNHYDKQMCGGN